MDQPLLTPSTERFSISSLNSGMKHLKCYVHPDTDAIGVCSVCKRGVCKPCQVVFEGKRFCKHDAEELLIMEEGTEEAHQRGKIITVAAVLAYLDGVTGALIGLLLISLGFIDPGLGPNSIISSQLLPSFSYFVDVFKF